MILECIFPVTTVANDSLTTLKKLKPTPPHENNEVLQNDGPPLYGK